VLPIVTRVLECGDLELIALERAPLDPFAEHLADVVLAAPQRRGLRVR